MGSYHHTPFAGIANELQSLNLPGDYQEAIIAQVRERVSSLGSGPRGRTVVDLARHVHRTRLRANEIMGARVLCDPKFEMLLEMYVARHDHRRLCVSDICHSANVPQTTGLRHVDKLEQLGFITRTADQRDRRRWWVELTERGISTMTELMGEFHKGS